MLDLNDYHVFNSTRGGSGGGSGGGGGCDNKIITIKSHALTIEVTK